MGLSFSVNIASQQWLYIPTTYLDTPQTVITLRNLDSQVYTETSRKVPGEEHSNNREIQTWNSLEKCNQCSVLQCEIIICVEESCRHICTYILLVVVILLPSVGYCYSLYRHLGLNSAVYIGA